MSFTTMMDRQAHLEKCKSKRWYESEDDADKAVIHMGRQLMIQYYFYHCPFCRLYHLTKKNYSKAKHLELWRQELAYQQRAKDEVS